MQDEEWSDWFTHDGNGCPLKTGMHIQIVMRRRGGKEAMLEGTCKAHTISAGSWLMKDCDGPWTQVIRYRIRRPRALRDLIEMVENLPAPVTRVGVMDEAR